MENQLYNYLFKHNYIIIIQYRITTIRAVPSGDGTQCEVWEWPPQVWGPVRPKGPEGWPQLGFEDWIEPSFIQRTIYYSCR